MLRADSTLNRNALYRAWDIHEKWLIPATRRLEPHIAKLLKGLTDEEQERALRLDVPVMFTHTVKLVKLPLLNKDQARRAVTVVNKCVQLVPPEEQFCPRKSKPTPRFEDGLVRVGRHLYEPKEVLQAIPRAVIEEFVRNTPLTDLPKRRRRRRTSQAEAVNTAAQLAKLVS